MISNERYYRPPGDLLSTFKNNYWDASNTSYNIGNGNISVHNTTVVGDFTLTADASVTQTTLREIYLRPFEMAVKDGKVWAVMNAYNMLNGEHCTANKWLNNTVLPRSKRISRILRQKES